MEFNRQRIVERHTTATEVLQENLPINPLSHLIITIDGWNATDEATLAELPRVLEQRASDPPRRRRPRPAVRRPVRRQRVSLPQAARMHRPARHRQRTAHAHLRGALRPPDFRPRRVFPRHEKGQLVLRVDTTVPATSWDNSTISIDAVELIGATPTRYLRCLRKALAAPGATGVFEFEMPTGNELVACQFRLVTVPTTSSHAYGVNIAKLMVDNKEYGYTTADMMVMCGERGLRVGAPNATIAAQGLGPLELIAWMDFDLRDNDEWLIDTAGKSSVKLSLDFGVNEAVNLTTMELVAV